MISYKGLLGEARKAIKTAEHLLVITYPFSGDPKMLVGIIKSIAYAQRSGLNAFIEQGIEEKTIPPLQDDYTGRLNWIILRGLFDDEQVKLLREVCLLIEMQEKCPIEFVRKDKYILYGDNYHIKTINAKEVQEYLTKTKLFIEKVTSAINQ